jgi:hypothetical protein
MENEVIKKTGVVERQYGISLVSWHEDHYMLFSQQHHNAVNILATER